MRKAIISSEDHGDLVEEFEAWLWFKPSTGEIYEFIDGDWTFTNSLLKVDGGNTAIPGTSEATKGEFTELEVGGENGIDHEVVVGAETLKFKGGILYKVV